jgi:hypothetical protein
MWQQFSIPILKASTSLERKKGQEGEKTNHIVLDTDIFFEPRKEEFFLIAVMLVYRYDPGVHKDNEVCNIFLFPHVRSLKIDTI